MPDRISFVKVTQERAADTGFFCYMSKRKTEGWARKLHWVRKRLAEGLRIRFSAPAYRAFIEYIPGEYAWRPVQAKGYMVIHCIWVVGRSKGKGLGALLIKECIKEARGLGMRGVAMVAGREWYMIRPEFLKKLGFVTVDTAPPSFELMVRKLSRGPGPSFVKDLASRASKYPTGITVFTSDQCPYLVAATEAAQTAAQSINLACRIIHFKSAQDVHRLSPSPYGVFSIVYNRQVLSHHPVGANEIVQSITKARRAPPGRTRIRS